MTDERKAIYYGQVELIPSIICDGYVLDDGTSVMSERGTADLLGIDQQTLRAVRGNWPPKTLKPFINEDLIVRGNLPPETVNPSIDKDFIVATNSVEVVADNSPHKGRNIIVYTAETIETLIFAYAMALAHDALRKNQKHIGKRCVILMRALARTALEAAIKEACGLPIYIQHTIQKYYIDAVKLLLEQGFVCSIDGILATKRDIANFLLIPLSTLNSFLRRHPEIKPVLLTKEQIRASGSRAWKMYGFLLNDVAKIAFSMHTITGIQLKEQLFGEISCFARPDTSIEVNWHAQLFEVFEGLGLYRNYQMGRYRADFYIHELGVVLECNGYHHRYYDVEKEKAREKFITQKYGLVRFHHQISLGKLINAILQVKPGEVIRLT